VDPEGNDVRLEIEAQLLGSTFTGTPNILGGFLPSGSEETILAILPEVGSHHWQFRTRDVQGAVSPWGSYGGNSELTDADFIVDTSSNTDPNPPVGISQHDDATGPSEPVGYLDAEGCMVIQATVSDPNPLQVVSLQVELKPVGTEFDGNPTVLGPWVAGGTPTRVTITGLTTGIYHWRACTRDSGGALSRWIYFGYNLESETDFSVNTTVNQSPDDPTMMVQFTSDGVTGIPTGSMTVEDGITLRATALDPGQNPWKLQVELSPTGNPINGIVAAESDLVISGTEASVSIAGLVDGSWFWRARAVDESGAVSEWVSSGGNPDFSVATAANQAPSVSAPAQYRTDGITSIGLGGLTNESRATFRAFVESGDVGQPVRLHVEVREYTEPFSDLPTASSAWAISGSDLEITTGSFENGKSYHWQVWTEDNNGEVSGMVAFGGSPDFTKTSNMSPLSPAGPQQYHLDGVTVLPVGGTTPHEGAILNAVITDPDGDPVRLQVEIQLAGQPFANVVSATSAAVPSGSVATIMISGLPNLTGYHWQVRAIDGSNETTVWGSFGANPEETADFRVDATFRAPGSEKDSGKSFCFGNVASSGGLSLVWILALLGSLLLGIGVWRR
jgi:hypothetical protein